MKRAFAVIGLIVLAQGTVTRAQTTYTWIGGGDNSWLTAGHWNPAGVPVSGDTVFINNGGTAHVQAGGEGRNSYLTLGDLAADQGAVEILGNNAELDIYQTIIGNYGTGRMTVSEGGELYSSGEVVYIGRYNGSSGTLTVTGKDSSGNASSAESTFYIGASGEGTLNVLGGASVEARAGSAIGRSATGQGTVVVDGSGSNIVLNTFADMIIGNQGSGSLIIRNGGNVYAYMEGGGSDENFYVGRSAGGTGSVLVTGSGSRWGCNNARTYIGDSGDGTVTVENGAGVSNNEFTLGNSAGSKGELTLTGSGSNWGGGGTSYIGDSGRGILTVENGATLRTGDAYIAHNAGSQGSATVTGSGSLWRTGVLRVGYEEPGSLVIEDGARVTSSEFRIGVFDTAKATVTGPGSRWETSGYGILSQSGNGTLDILNGGHASMQESWLGWDNGSSGTVNVDGAGSQWINSMDMEIGHSAGQGTVNITGGGYASAKTVYLGTGAGSSGTAVVDGAGSQLYASNGLQVGTAGTGSLTVRNGGLVSVMNTVAAGSKGTVVLDDATLRLNLAGGTNSSLTGTLSGNGALEKLGAGTLTLRDDSGYTGSVTIGAGTVVTGANNSLSYQTRIDMGEQGTLSLEGGQRFASLSGAGTVLNNGWTLSTGDDTDTTFSGSIQGNGGFIKSATGSGTMTLTGKSTYTGRTYVNGGTLRIAGTDERLYDGGSVDIDSGGTFQVDGVTQTIGELTALGRISLVNGGTLRLDAGQTYSGSTLTGDGALEKFGTGTLDLLGDNSSFSGNVTLSEGTLNTSLIAVGAHGTGLFRNTGGTHTMTNNLYVGTYSDGTGTYELSGSGSLTTRGLFLGNEGTATLQQSGGTGSVTRSMYLGYWPGGDGTYNLIDGTMTIANDLYIGGKSDQAGGAGTVNLSGGQLTVNGTVKVWDDGTLNLIAGTMTLANPLIMDGALTGRGTINGSVIMGENGLVSPGNSPGLLTINGDYTQNALATLEIELGGLLRGGEYDALVVTGTMNLAGTLDVTLWNGFEPLAGNSFDILDWGTLNGTFDFVNLPGLAAGLSWDTTSLYTAGLLSISSNTPPGPGPSVPAPSALMLGVFGLGLLGRLRRPSRKASRDDDRPHA